MNERRHLETLPRHDIVRASLSGLVSLVSRMRTEVQGDRDCSQFWSSRRQSSSVLIHALLDGCPLTFFSEANVPPAWHM